MRPEFRTPNASLITARENDYVMRTLRVSPSLPTGLITAHAGSQSLHPTGSRESGR
jgi:hypothetical protein